MTRALGVLLLILFSLPFAQACSGFGSRIREHTYPPDFRYIPRAEVESAMWLLSRDVYELDRIMRAEKEIDPGRRARIVELLDSMNATAAKLDTAGDASNHPTIDVNLERFRDDIMLAKRSVEAEPPSYFLVGALSGACVPCHTGR